MIIQRSSIFDALCEAVDAARTACADHPAWLARVNAAWEWLLDQEQYEVIDPGTDHAAVVIPSATEAGVSYAANGACQCRAYSAHTPCWHRAASRLVRNALEVAHVNDSH